MVAIREGLIRETNDNNHVCTRQNCLLQAISLDIAKPFERHHPAPCRQVAEHRQGLERCLPCNEILHSLKSIAIQLQEYNPVMFYHLPLLPSFLRAPKVFLGLLFLFDIWLKEWELQQAEKLVPPALMSLWNRTHTDRLYFLSCCNQDK